MSELNERLIAGSSRYEHRTIAGRLSRKQERVVTSVFRGGGPVGLVFFAQPGVQATGSGRLTSARSLGPEREVPFIRRCGPEAGCSL